jgi:hypothetical protein
VPGTVRVTLYWLLGQRLVFGLALVSPFPLHVEVGRLAPLGSFVKWMSWTLVVSWLTKMMVVPGATVTVVGLKLSDGLPPIPAGSMIC